MSGSTTAAVIVNWRSSGDTLRLVESLLPNATSDGLRFVVLENGSNDGSAEELRERFAAPPFVEVVTYIVSETNLGFCAGVNRAVDVALAADPKPDYIWMLNPDTYPDTTVLPEMVAVAKESGFDVISARAGTGSEYAGEGRWPLPYFAPAFMWRTRAVPGARWWETGRYHGGCVLWERSLVERLIAGGEFHEERLFMYWDEWETSLRAAKLGGRVCVAANARVPHHSPDRNALPGLSETRMYYAARNGILSGRKWFPRWVLPFLLPPHIGRGYIYYCLLRGASSRAYMQGILDGFRGRTGMWSKHPG